MKICLAFENLGDGGAQRAMLLLAKELSKDHQIEAIIFEKKPNRYTAEQLSKVIEIGRLLPVQLMTIMKWSLKNKDVPIVTTQANVTRVFALAKSLRIIKNPLIIREANRLGQSKSKGQTLIWDLFIEKIYKKSNHFIALSKSGKSDLLEIRKCPSEKITVIKNCINTLELNQLAQKKTQHKWLEGDRPYKTIVAAGRFVEQKALDQLIRATPDILARQDVRVIILGEGELRKKYEELISKLGLEDFIDLPGFVDNPYAYFKESDVFVLCSKWEGSPNVLLEAMAVGTTVVSTDCPSGPREIITSTDIGYLCRANDIQELTSAIITALEHPINKPHLSSYMKQNYNSSEWANKYLSIIESVKDAKKP